ncbi:MAG: hypothetical protein Q8P72_03790 [Candidatus Roizmanbacteria bacterium]|nr:hypothetical protein [Candidatus Roizmanbacteria bacterium]
MEKNKLVRQPENTLMAIGLMEKDARQIQSYYGKRKFGYPQRIWEELIVAIQRSHLAHDHDLKHYINQQSQPWLSENISMTKVDDLSIQMYRAGVFPIEKIDYVLRLPVDHETLPAQQYVAQIYSPLGFIMTPQSFGQLWNLRQDYLIHDLRILYQEAHDRVFPRRKNHLASYMALHQPHDELMYFIKDRCLKPESPIVTRYTDLIATGSFGYHAHRQSLQLGGHFVGPRTPMKPWDPEMVQAAALEDIEGNYLGEY